MAIITVSRELAALGDETAREIAGLLGYRLVDKDYLEERIQACGIEEKKFRKYDERKPSFFAALSQDRDDYLHYLRTAILAEADKGDCVFVGRGAGVVLNGLPALLSVFLSARMEVRVERIKNWFHCDEKRAAQIVERSDRDRSGFHSSFFGIEWRHPGNYHLTFNTGIFGPADCAAVVATLKDRVFLPESEAQNLAALKDMTLGHRVRHRILYELELPIQGLEISALEGTVILRGVTNSQALLDAAVKSADEVAGVESVRNEIQVIREYSVTP